MTQPAIGSQCDHCGARSNSHTAADHPLPKDHPDYDAFFDASDDELSEMASAALNATTTEHPA